MNTKEPSSSLSSTLLSSSSIIRHVKKMKKELDGDDDNKDDDDEENHQWIGFFENITNNNNLDDKDKSNDDDDDRNEGASAGRTSSTIMMKTEEEEVPDNIPSKSGMIKMEEEEVDEDVFTSIINSTLVWGDGTITGRVTAFEGQQQVKKEGKNKEEEEEEAAEKEDDNGNAKGSEPWTEGISPNTNAAFQTAASTNHCVRRKFNCDNNKDDDDVHDDDVHVNVDDERKPPPKKKIRVLAAVEEDINCEADKDHIIDDDYGDCDGDGTSSKIIPTESMYTNSQIEFWNKMFRRFVVYKEQNGNTNIARSYKEDPQLGAWIKNQRTCYRNNKVSKYRMDLLDGVGFVWGNIYGAQWMEIYQRLIIYKKQHKTTSVPKYYNEDQMLATWVRNQRQFYKNKKLSIKRINYLELIGFVWKIRVLWIEMYEKLIAYKKQHKTTSVPTYYKEDQNLGGWVHNQRIAYRNKKLSIERINYLESIGFVWKVCVLWIEMYERLVAYKYCHQSTLVPRKYTEDPNLGVWVTKQRVAYNKDKLSEKRME